MTARLRIKARAVEFEYETEAALSIDDIKTLLGEVEAFSATVGTQGDRIRDGGAVVGDDSGGGGANSSGSQKLHVTSIAAKLDAKGGRDLALAAAAHLQITDGKESFTRQELLLTMKKAPKFYKANMSKNLSSIISSLIPDKLNQIGEGVYSLTAAEHRELETKLA